MFSKNIFVDGLVSDAKYVFQYCKNVEVHNAKIVTKDSFWECDGVTVYDSDLNGEYLAWHSKNVRLVRCHISGEQPLCYMDGITLEDCTFDPACDRAFEDSRNINARISGTITEVKIRSVVRSLPVRLQESPLTSLLKVTERIWKL